jgi:hypothetical protein
MEKYKPIIEKHNLNDVLEIKKMKKLLRKHDDMVLMLDLMINICNKSLNHEVREVIKIDTTTTSEEDEPELSDHSSDE